MTISVQVLSDLHFNTQEAADILGALGGQPSGRADLVVLAGDVDLSHRSVGRVASLFPDVPVVMVAGNHEPRRTGLTIDEGIALMRAEAARARREGREIHVLEDEEVLLEVSGVAVRVLGSTLWTDFELAGTMDGAVARAAGHANDHAWCPAYGGPVIKGSIGCDLVGNGRLSPRETAARHRRARRFLARRLLVAHDGPTVVVTHHLPSMRSVSPRFSASPHNAEFASDADALLEVGAALWVHGHTHTSLDYRSGGGTRVVCNPLGRVAGGRENPDFDRAMVVGIARDTSGRWRA